MRHLKVGITGGIGSGKTTACNLFADLGIPIYNADKRAKDLMGIDPGLKKNIRQALGWDSYDKNDQLNSPYIAKIVFNNPQQLRILNAIVHPAVFEDYEKWIVEQANSNIPYSIKEAALMIESGSYQNLDKLVVVTAPIDVRLERTMKRDHMKREEVLKRMHNQLSDKERLDKADFVLKNSNDFSMDDQVTQLHNELLKLSSGGRNS
jgi:dephospho-CoA kinase